MTGKTEDKQQAVRMPWQKRAADLLTFVRGPLALVMVWLGYVRGKDAVLLAFGLLLVAATLDTLDGALARRSRYPYQTWIGAHDVLFDIGFSVALLFYLTLAGYLSPYLAIVHFSLWMWLLFGKGLISDSLIVLFQAPMYAGIALAAGFHNVDSLLWVLIWAGFMLIFAGRRFFNVRLPAFFKDLSDKVASGIKGIAPWAQSAPVESLEKRRETRVKN